MTKPFDLAFRSQITDLRRREKFALKELNTRVLKAILEKEPWITNNLTATPVFSVTAEATKDPSLKPKVSKGNPKDSAPAADYSDGSRFFDFVRKRAENKLQGLKQNTLTRIRNRCVLSGRSSTLKKFRLSRIAFRELAGSGKLQGVTKRLHK